MSPRKTAVEALLENGFRLRRQGANHEIYQNASGAMIPLKRHDFNDNDLKYILSEIRKAIGEGRPQ